MKKHLLACLVLLFIASGYVFAQTNININKKNISIRNVLYEIEKQSGHSVAFDEENIDVEKKISLSLKNKSLNEALESILEGTDCTYTIKNNHIIISRGGTNKLAQEGTPRKNVTGTVADEHGDPLIGVTVRIAGEETAVVTNIDGKFQVSNVSSNSTLRISYLGFTTQDIKVGNANDFNISLLEDSQLLDEVVVVGYNTVRKKDLTTSVAVVSTADIAERPITQGLHKPCKEEQQECR